MELTHHPLLPLHGEVEDVPLEVKGHQRRGTDWRDKQSHELSQQDGMGWGGKGRGRVTAGHGTAEGEVTH